MNSILILDDDPDILHSLTALFKFEGFKVLPVENINKMDQYLERDSPDVFLIDVVLGNDDGRDVCKKLKADARFKHTPMMLMSGIPNYHSDHAGNPVFADDYIDKPFDSEEILEKVLMLLQDE